MSTRKTTTPVAEAAAGVTSEIPGAATTTTVATEPADEATEQLIKQFKADLFAANERANIFRADLEAANQKLDDADQKIISLDAALDQCEKFLKDEVAKREETEEKLVKLQDALENLNAKSVAKETNKLLYKSESGNVYEITQADFRFKGSLHKADDVLQNNPGLFEELLAANSFILKKIE